MNRLIENSVRALFKIDRAIADLRTRAHIDEYNHGLVNGLSMAESMISNKPVEMIQRPKKYKCYLIDWRVKIPGTDHTIEFKIRRSGYEKV